MSRTSIDQSMFDLFHYLAKNHTMDEINRIIYPLEWYIETGRASTEFLHEFCTAKPFVIARILCKGGSDDEIIKMIKKKLGC